MDTIESKRQMIQDKWVQGSGNPFGYFVLTYREQHPYTLEEAAELLQVTPEELSRIEEQAVYPTANWIALLCKIFELPDNIYQKWIQWLPKAFAEAQTKDPAVRYVDTVEPLDEKKPNEGFEKADTQVTSSFADWFYKKLKECNTNITQVIKFTKIWRAKLNKWLKGVPPLEGRQKLEQFFADVASGAIILPTKKRPGRTPKIPIPGTQPTQAERETIEAYPPKKLETPTQSQASDSSKIIEAPKENSTVMEVKAVAEPLLTKGFIEAWLVAPITVGAPQPRSTTDPPHSIAQTLQELLIGAREARQIRFEQGVSPQLWLECLKLCMLCTEIMSVKAQAILAEKNEAWTAVIAAHIRAIRSKYNELCLSFQYNLGMGRRLQTLDTLIEELTHQLVEAHAPLASDPLQKSLGQFLSIVLDNDSKEAPVTDTLRQLVSAHIQIVL